MSEAKVGLLAVVVVAVLVGGTIFLSGASLLRGGKQVYVHFRNVEGLSDGAIVSFIGVPIGRVTDISLATEQDLAEFPERPVVVRLTLDREAPIFDTDEFTVAQPGPLGETHVAVVRKTTAERAEEAALLGVPLRNPQVVASKQHLTGEKAVGLMELGDDARAVLTQVRHAVADLQSVYAGPSMKEKLPQIMENVRLATGNAVALSAALARLSVGNEARIGRVAQDIASMASEMNRTAARVHSMVLNSAPDVEASTSRVAALVQTSAASLEATAKTAERTGTRIEQLVNTSATDLEATTRATRQVVETTGQHLTKTGANLELASANLADDLTATTRRVRELIEGSSANIEAAAAEVERSTRSIAALVEQSSADLGASSKRVASLVERGAADVEEASANLAAMSRDLRSDLTSVSGKVRDLVDQSGADIQRTTARIAELTERSAGDIERTTRRVSDLLASSPLPADLAVAGSHIRSAAENVSAITGDLRGTLANQEFQGQIRTIAANLARTSENLVVVSETTQALLEDGRGLVSTSRGAIDRISAQIGDEAMWTDMRGTVSQLRKAMDDLSAITEHGREVFTDPALTDDLRASLHQVRQITDRGVALVDQAGESLRRVDATMDRVTGVTSQLKPSKFMGWAALQAGDGTGLRADVNADLYFGSSTDFWRLGVYDLGDGERLNLQRGLGMGDGSALRLGIFANKLGLGCDYLFSPSLGFEAEVWDPDDPRLDARALWRLGTDWDLFVGADDIFSQTQPFVGLRSRLPFSAERKTPRPAASPAEANGAAQTQETPK